MRAPPSQDVTFPATALIALPVVKTLISPLRLEVVTNQATRPKARQIQGVKMAAAVDMRFQRRMRPTGMEAPPTMTPSTVRIHVKFTLTALRMAQKLARTVA